MRTKIGILGSGQLSQMMVQASRRLGISVRILASSAKDSAALDEGAEVIVGKVSDPQELKKFLTGLEVVGFESELIDVEALRHAATEFIPSLSVMRLLSEKLEQKRLLSKLGIATAPYEDLPEDLSDADLAGWIKALQKKWGPFVLKWSKYGYDGRGVMMVPQSEEGLALALESTQAALKKGTKVYAEQKVNFKRELALVSVRSIEGHYDSYPLVISVQKSGVCHWVEGPAVSRGVSPTFEEKARKASETLAHALDLCGVFAIEFFETESGELWVNEIAPRVHNSGHFTQDACAHDQFEMYLRVLSKEEKLPSLKSTPRFAMINLLGPPGIKGNFEDLEKKLPAPPKGLFLHWYGKQEVFPGRKLGHVNSAEGELGKLRAYEKKWIDFLKELQP